MGGGFSIAYRAAALRGRSMKNGQKKGEREKEEVVTQELSLSGKSPLNPVGRMGWLCFKVMTTEGRFHGDFPKIELLKRSGLSSRCQINAAVLSLIHHIHQGSGNQSNHPPQPHPPTRDGALGVSHTVILQRNSSAYTSDGSSGDCWSEEAPPSSPRRNQLAARLISKKLWKGGVVLTNHLRASLSPPGPTQA